jgi:hypothetical protein
MEENLKTRVILLLGILTAIFFVSTISSCGNVYKNKLAHGKEIVKRVELEKKLVKISQEKTAQDEKLGAVVKELEQERGGHEVTKKALVQEQLVNESLKEELVKVTKLKEALEEDLKEALVQGAGSSASKKAN